MIKFGMNQLSCLCDIGNNLYTDFILFFYTLLSFTLNASFSDIPGGLPQWLFSHTCCRVASL